MEGIFAAGVSWGCGDEDVYLVRASSKEEAKGKMKKVFGRRYVWVEDIVWEEDEPDLALVAEFQR